MAAPIRSARLRGTLLQGAPRTSVRLAGAALLGLALGAAAPATTGAPTPTGTVRPLEAEALYRGWRARPLLGSPLRDGPEGRSLGTIRDLVVDANGRAAAILVEAGEAGGLPEAVYRVPWADLVVADGRAALRSGRNASPSQYALAPDDARDDALPREFRTGEVIGDYARLQTGYGYGIVTDLAFTRDGRVNAVLVSRSASTGGGTVALPFYGVTNAWDPGASYYGLPFVTPEQAGAAALKVELRRFEAAAPR